MVATAVVAAISLFGVVAAGSAATEPAAPVVLNEINCEGVDWIELANPTDAAVDVSGWVLSDDALDREPPRADHRFALPAATTIPAGGLLVYERGTDFPFGISCDDDVIRLGDGLGALVDQVAMPGAALGSAANTWGRLPHGVGPFIETAATRGTTNLPAAGDEDPDLATWLFDPAAVTEIELTLPQASRDALAADPQTYRDGSFSLSAGATTYGPLDVGIRLKGRLGSFRELTGKAAFKLKFDHSVAAQRFFGLRKLTLNNMVQDPTMQHEVLAYELFRAAGVAAPRTGYAFVRLDGVDYGLYLNVETLDSVALRRWFDTTRHLYEGSYGGDVVPARAGELEVDEGADGDRTDLDALVAAVGGAGPLGTRLAGLADLDQMTAMWAVERYVGQWDGYSSTPFEPNNYFLHSDATGLFTMLPWGADQALARRLHFVGGGGVLFRACLADPDCFERYRGQLLELPAIAAALELGDRLDAAAELIAPWQGLDPRSEFSAAQVEANLTRLRRLLGKRGQDVTDPSYWLADGPPETTIRRGPAPVLWTRGLPRSVRMRFSSSEPGSRYECRLDRGPWWRCRSPERFRVAVGRHVFSVRAFDPAANPDPSPARRRWAVRRR